MTWVEKPASLIAQKILSRLSLHSRRLPCTHAEGVLSLAECASYAYQQLKASIAMGRPIDFILPAFPAKSPNREKTHSALPDLGERLALRFLDRLCQSIKRIYPPGANLLICSDGRVFNDLVRVADHEVDAYMQGIRHMIREYGLTHLSTFSLDDYFQTLSYDEMRLALENGFADDLAIIKARTKNEANAKALFNGIHRFVFEDALSLDKGMSRNAIRNHAKEIAYKVIQRSNAWSTFVAKHFPQGVRLSIHPQLCGSEKYGVMLLKSNDVWATPWHRVVLHKGKDFLLVRQKEALSVGAKAVYHQQQFSHYTMHGVNHVSA